MASLDSLPPDQRAVIDLVLQRGRGYDEIARLLGIDRAAVRARALAAFDALGPDTGVPPERRALITDYLLGQLPAKVAEQTAERLAESPSERAWARALASELAPLAKQPLPEIPVESSVGEASSRPEPVAAAATAASRAEQQPAAPAEQQPAAPAPPSRRPPGARRVSRLGGAIILAIGAAIVVAIVLILVLSGGSKPKPAAAPHTTTTSAAATSSTTATSAAHVVAQINLNPPPGGGGTTRGVAFVVKQGSASGIVIQAQNIAPNSKHNAYAVWLYNSPTDNYRLGFVNPGVGTNGRLQTGGGLPTNAGHYKELLVTLETQSNPRAPGNIVLEGTLKGLS